MTDDTIEATKAALRVRAHAQRASFLRSEQADAARAAMSHFLEAVALPDGAVVAGYWPIRDELDCKPLLAHLMDSGQPVCLPVVVGEEQPLEMRLWEVGAPLYPSGFGTLAPPETAPLVEPDVVLVPLLGYDRSGTRLGYGGGYYDRTLARFGKRPMLVGFAYTAQELEAIPRATHDVTLDALVTEAGVRFFGESRAA